MPSITASSYNIPYSQQLYADLNFYQSSSFPVVNAKNAVSGSTNSIYLANMGAPTCGNVLVQLFTTTLTNTSNSAVVSMSIQNSVDNVNWSQIQCFSPQVLSAPDNGNLTSSATTAQVYLPPNVDDYIRATVMVNISGSTLGGVTGSYGIQCLF